MRRFGILFGLCLAMILVAPGPAWRTGSAAAAAPASQAAAKSFAIPELESDAVRVRAAVRKAMAEAAKGHPADALFADGMRDLSRDPSAAVDAFGAAIAAGRDDAAVWFGLANTADAAAANEKDDTRRGTLNDWALPAAYLAYRRSTNARDEAGALAELGDLYAKRESWRPALNSYKASLAAFDDPGRRKTYEAMRAEHGFRITDYKIDSDSASARACFQFSDPLAKGRTDLASFVALDGSANAAVSVEDQQLCVEGLNHGQRYAITLRQGLPSGVGENLLQSADYDIYVRDRSPQVRFGGKTYVLPRIGPEGIPVTSVNTGKVDVTILRIGDRNLAPTVRSDDFLGQLYSNRLDSLAADDGAKVWSGTLDVEQRLNEDVTTAFPVLDAVGRMAPGVYVMQAKPHSDAPADSDSGLRATQWFVVSDLGLTALSGEDGITALVRSLSTAAPVAGIELRLLARDNEVLATKTTDASGTVHFDPGLSRGEGGNAPQLIVGSGPDGDYNFLDVAQAPFDLTDRGVKGRAAPKGLDAFVYAERGVYRSGETVYLTALVRSLDGSAATGVPITLVIKRPDGVEDKRIGLADAGLGGHSVAMPLIGSAATGTWRVEAYADPKGQPIGETSFLVEDYLPERLAFALAPQSPTLDAGAPARIATTTRFLYGAPGKTLEISGETIVEAASKPAWPALEGYAAGLTDETVESVTTPLPDTVKTDAKGEALVVAPVPDVSAPRATEAKIVLRVGEPGGRAIERSVTLPILPKTALIGVKKTFTTLGEGDAAGFDVVVVGPDGRRMAKSGLHWSLYRLDNDYQWFNDGGHWDYQRVKSSKRVADGTLIVTAEGAAHITAPVSFGSHRLDLASDDPDLPPTSISFDVGFSGDATAQSPDLLDMTLDKTEYAPGESLRADIHARFAGRATLAIANAETRALTTVDLKAGDNAVTLPVDKAWGSGAYAVVLAHRPLDAKARRMPGRALGLAWFGVDRQAHRLDVSIAVPDKVLPRQDLVVPVRLGGLAPGEEAAVTVSAVDVGILNLTRYETPQPNDYFFGQHALGVDVRDVYGYLIDGLGIARGAIRSGGDSGGELADEKPTQPPLARYSGIVKVGPDGTASVTFDIPAFNGTVRVAAVAWSKTRTGSAEADVIVRDPIVVAGSLPRFLNLGDQTRAHFDFDDVEGPAGTYAFRLDPKGPWFFAADALDQSVKLEPGSRAGLDVPMTAAGLGRAELATRLVGNGADFAQDFALRIESGAPTVSRRDIRSLAPGASITLSSDLLAEFVPGTGSVSVAASPVGAIDVPALLAALDRYPVGCSEQIVSRALPLLYVNQLAPVESLALDAAVPQRIRDAIALLLSRQGSEGSFGLWSADSGSANVWLDAYVSDFLTRAHEAGYAVPAKAFDAALDRLRNFVANNGEAKDDDAVSLAYAIYVLARNGRPVLGDLHYLASTRLDAFATPLAEAQIGAALALLGDRDHAAKVFAAATDRLTDTKEDRGYRADYGSKLRDAAAVLALVAESGLSNGIVRAGTALEQAEGEPFPLTTQEEAWMILAAQAVEAEAKDVALTLDGAPHKGAFYRRFTAGALDAKPVTLGNAGPAQVRVVVSTAGQMPTPEPAAAAGYALERHYYKLDGTEVDPATVRQNERLVVVLKVTEDEAVKARVLLTDPLPAGFEIDNPELVAGGSIAALPFLTDEVTPVHSEFHDDRFLAAFDRDSDQPAFFNVAYIVRAVTPGHYVHPAATIEDMYRPERFGRTASGVVDVKGPE